MICGFGRTGNWFGAQTLGMKPHSISMAKAITSAYFPMGAITIEEDLYQAMLEESKKIGTFGHGFTYTAHPVGLRGGAQDDRNLRAHRHRRSCAQGGARCSTPALTGSRIIRWSARCARVGLIGAAELVADKKTRRAFDPKQAVGATCVDVLQESSA